MFRAAARGKDKEIVEASVLDRLGARRGHFRYESGHHGELWLDLDRLFVDPRGVAPLARELAARLARREVEAVVGPLAGGAFLAQMIATELGVNFAYAAPAPSAPSDALFSVAYRLPPTVAPLLKGRRVAIVDDAVNAGSALRGTFRALTEAEAKPAALGALVVLGDAILPFLEEEGVALERLASRPNPLWTPSECPLCARGIPLSASGAG
jgi:orotate phosphoribosyltransferase